MDLESGVVNSVERLMHSHDPVLLVSSFSARILDFFNANTGAKLATLHGLMAQPHEIALDSKRRLAYATHTYRNGAYGEGYEKGHELSVIDVDARCVIDVIDTRPFMAPHDVEYDVANDLIYASVELAEGYNGIVIIDPDTRKVIGNIPTRARNSHWCALSSVGKLYVVHKEVPEMSVIDPIARKVLGTIALPGGAEEAAASPDGRWIFVNTPQLKADIDIAKSGKLYRKKREAGDAVPQLLRIDTATDTITGALELEEYCGALSVSANNTVVTNQMIFGDRPDPDAPATPDAGAPLPGVAVVVDGETMMQIGAVPVGRMPFTTRISPDGKTAWVALVADGKVAILDLDSMTVRGELDNNASGRPGGTHGLCYVPAVRR